MNVEENCCGVPITPETRALVRAVFERSLDRDSERVDHLRVRLVSVRDGVQCRVKLTPWAGAAIVTVATRDGMVDAVVASAFRLVTALERRASTQRRRQEKRAVTTRDDGGPR